MNASVDPVAKIIKAGTLNKTVTEHPDTDNVTHTCAKLKRLVTQLHK